MGKGGVKMAPRLAAPVAEPVGPAVPDLDAGAVEAMAAVGASDLEIADYLGQPAAAIVARFGAVLSWARAARGLRIREAEQRAATAGNGRALGAAARAVKFEQERRASAERTRRRWKLPAEGER